MDKQREWLQKCLTTSMALYAIALPTSMAGMEIFGWLAVAIFVLLQATRFKQGQSFALPRSGLEWALGGFFLVSISGMLFVEGINSNEKLFVLGSLRWILMFYGLYYIFINRHFSPSLFLKILFVVGCIVCIYCIPQVLYGWDIFRSKPYSPNHYPYGIFWRAKGFFSNPITFANSFGMLFFFASSYYLVQLSHKIIHKRILISLGMIVFILAIILSMTRGIWIAVLINSLILPILIPKKSIRLGMYGVIFAFLTIVLSNKPLRQHLQSSVVTSESNAGKRLKLWRINWEIFKDHPWLGVGLHQNSKHSYKYHVELFGRRDMESHAHNVFLQVLAGTGIFGFLFFVGFLVQNFFKSLKAFQSSSRQDFFAGISAGFLMSLSCLVIGGMTEVNFFDGEVNHMFISLMALFHSQYSLSAEKFS